MKTSHRFAINSIAIAMLFGIGGCARMSQQGQDTAVAASVGAIGGAVLTGGSAAGTVGGAAVGGFIGHEISK